MIILDIESRKLLKQSTLIKMSYTIGPRAEREILAQRKNQRPHNVFSRRKTIRETLKRNDLPSYTNKSNLRLFADDGSTQRWITCGKQERRTRSDFKGLHASGLRLGGSRRHDFKKPRIGALEFPHLLLPANREIRGTGISRFSDIFLRQMFACTPF